MAEEINIPSKKIVGDCFEKHESFEEGVKCSLDGLGGNIDKVTDSINSLSEKVEENREGIVRTVELLEKGIPEITNKIDKVSDEVKEVSTQLKWYKTIE